MLASENRRFVANYSGWVMAARCESTAGSFAPMSAINAKGVVQREHGTVVYQLAHPHQAGVSKRQGDVAISLNQRQDCGQLLLHRERDKDNTLLPQPEYRLIPGRNPACQKSRFGNHRFASEQRRVSIGKTLVRPAVVNVSPIEKGNQRASIQQ